MMEKSVGFMTVHPDFSNEPDSIARLTGIEAMIRAMIRERAAENAESNESAADESRNPGLYEAGPGYDGGNPSAE